MAAERRGGGKDFTRATGVPGGRGHALEGRAWECAGMRRATIAMRRSIMTTSKWSIKGWKRRNMVASCRGSGVGEEPRDIRMIRLCAVLSRLSEIPTFPFSTFRLSGPGRRAPCPVARAPALRALACDLASTLRVRLVWASSRAFRRVRFAWRFRFSSDAWPSPPVFDACRRRRFWATTPCGLSLWALSLPGHGHVGVGRLVALGCHGSPQPDPRVTPSRMNEPA